MDSSEQNSDYEKLRDELFEVRVDYKSWLRSLKIIATSISVILFILAFFGYSKIESIENTIYQQVDERLQITDSLLSSIDQSKIDSLNSRLREKEREYDQTIKNLESTIDKSKELQEKLLESMPANSRTQYSLESHYEYSSEGLFTTNTIPQQIKPNSKFDINLIIHEEVDLNKIDVIYLSIIKRDEDDNRILVKNNFYELNERLNKIPVRFDLNKGKFNLRVGYIVSEDGENYFYNKRVPITIK
ncbi:hypothetical protein [Fodinibius saliphilus]|uniref:hypothetical protein n=1 Tax=Fodinibius saliphilus TaxID=1920650 RepID=UPI00110841DC|nr:hypothetical protein [Fodinibius saliphilus]